MKQARIKPKFKVQKFSQKDQEMFKDLFSYLTPEDKRNIAKKFHVTEAYVRYVLNIKRNNIGIFSYAINIATTSKKNHLKMIKEASNV